KSHQRLVVQILMTDAPELLKVSIVKRQRFKDMRQESIEHRDVRGQSVGAHRPGFFCGNKSNRPRRKRLLIIGETARIPGHEQEVFLTAGNLMSTTAERPPHRDWQSLVDILDPFLSGTGLSL